MTQVLGPDGAQYGAIFAFQIAPTIIFIAALFAILYYFGVMQLVVRLFALVMNQVMGASGAESLNVAASIFMGQTEAPLTIRPYLPRMTESELMTVMTSGMAHISGGIMAAYIAFGIEPKHLLTAVIMTAPGTLMMAKMFVPETAVPETLGTVRLERREDRRQRHRRRRPRHRRGPAPGDERHRDADLVRRAHRADQRDPRRHRRLGSASRISACRRSSAGCSRRSRGASACRGRTPATIGNLLGTRMVLNEFIAFAQLGPMKDTLDPRSFTVATFALCGFANFASIGIQIGGIGALVPERRHDLARLGMRAMLAGTLANFASACIAALLL